MSGTDAILEALGTPFYQDDEGCVLYCGDSLDLLPKLPANCIDSVVTDPPYGIGLMGREWDRGVPNSSFWSPALRACKPGATMLAFCAPRTYHILASAIDASGWNIKDCVQWIYGSGMPKCGDLGGDFKGWRLSLKPANELICLAEKKLDGAGAKNAAKWGVAGLNIDGCRVPYASEEDRLSATPGGACTSRNGNFAGKAQGGETERREFARPELIGRFPTNVIHDGSDEALSAFGDESRFFYCAKASKSEKGAYNTHPTVKPLALMEYLCRLTMTPTGGIVLDPFAGSGTTLLAARKLGRPCIGIEKDEAHCEITARRLSEGRMQLA